ncbi:hypothetical protein ACJIZ3_006077 [Penstemon smallii]|uniref:Cytochrome P450 n=1 Tax=Penstemon smallii TaxID=265156 RepID=A0ABD3S6S3_9LAMI
MELFSSSVLVILCFVTVWAWVHNSNSRIRKSIKPLPPGPYPLPIIGNILQLGQSPHKSLAKLSKKYGPLMYLKLGSLDTVVVSSPEMAKEILQKHDQVFSDRTILVASQAHDYHNFSLGFLPVGGQWKNLRKICKEHMFSTPQLDSSKSLRQEKLHKLRDYVQECCHRGQAINFAEAAFKVTLSLMSATLFSIDLAPFDSNSCHELKEMVRSMMEVLGTPNLADFFPVLKRVDPQGIKHKSNICIGKLLDFFEDIINQRLQSRDSSEVQKDLLEALLNISQRNESELSSNQIKYLLMDLFSAGTDTTATTVEWAMTELLRNPEKMSKAQQEIRGVIGENEQVEESDISRLPYLQAVVKEVLRCHPAGPLLVPHKAETDVEIDGYMIPKNAQVLVNFWAIGRDSNVWFNPDSFEPERFLDKKIDYKGQDFELIPFGSGRRMCPGYPLAHRMLHLILATLVHRFNWKLEGGMKPEEVDLNDKFGITLEKAVPLKAVPTHVF